MKCDSPAVGAAERLHGASCRHVGALPEVERGERAEYAQCSQPLVRHLDAGAEFERRERSKAAPCSYVLVYQRRRRVVALDLQQHRTVGEA